MNPGIGAGAHPVTGSPSDRGVHDSGPSSIYTYRNTRCDVVGIDDNGVTVAVTVTRTHAATRDGAVPLRRGLDGAVVAAARAYLRGQRLRTVSAVGGGIPLVDGGYRLYATRVYARDSDTDLMTRVLGLLDDWRRNQPHPQPAGGIDHACDLLTRRLRPPPTPASTR